MVCCWLTPFNRLVPILSCWLPVIGMLGKSMPDFITKIDNLNWKNGSFLLKEWIAYREVWSKANHAHQIHLDLLIRWSIVVQTVRMQYQQPSQIYSEVRFSTFFILGFYHLFWFFMIWIPLLSIHLIPIALFNGLNLFYVWIYFHVWIDWFSFWNFDFAWLTIESIPIKMINS